MAFSRQTTAKLVKPLPGSIIRRFTAGATIAAGELVSMMADGYVDPTDTGAFTGCQIVGVALQAVASAAKVDVVTYGPVTAVLEGTPAAIVYGSDTAGEPSESAGTKDAIAGWNESATVLFVKPRLIDLS